MHLKLLKLLRDISRDSKTKRHNECTVPLNMSTTMKVDETPGFIWYFPSKHSRIFISIFSHYSYAQWFTCATRLYRIIYAIKLWFCFLKISPLRTYFFGMKCRTRFFFFSFQNWRTKITFLSFSLVTILTGRSKSDITTFKGTLKVYSFRLLQFFWKKKCDGMSKT